MVRCIRCMGIAGGGGGIRTPESSRSNSFQDYRIQPLCHPSVAGVYFRERQTNACSKGNVRHANNVWLLGQKERLCNAAASAFPADGICIASTSSSSANPV